MTEQGLQRVVVEHVTPEIDAGRFYVKKTIGDTVRVEADIFTDGHDHSAGALRNAAVEKNQILIGAVAASDLIEQNGKRCGPRDRDCISAATLRAPYFDPEVC